MVQVVLKHQEVYGFILRIKQLILLRLIMLLKNPTIVVPLKYLSNFWRSLEILLFNCKVELKI